MKRTHTDFAHISFNRLRSRAIPFHGVAGFLIIFMVQNGFYAKTDAFVQSLEGKSNFHISCCEQIIGNLYLHLWL